MRLTRFTRHKHTCRPWLRLIPYPLTCLEMADRFHHRDVPQLTAAAMWAESTLLTVALARRAHNRRLDCLILSAQNAPIRESDWLRDRLQRLDTETRQRRGRRAA